MADAIYGWIKNLAFFFIFLTVILNLLPDEKYRKYVKSFLGLLLLLVVCKPLFALFGLGDVLAGYLRMESIGEKFNELENSAEILNDETYDYYREAVLAEVCAQVKEAARAHGLTPEEGQAQMRSDGSGLRLLSVHVRGEERASESFQKEMMQTYELTAAQVQITRLEEK